MGFCGKLKVGSLDGVVMQKKIMITVSINRMACKLHTKSLKKEIFTISNNNNRVAIIIT